MWLVRIILVGVIALAGSFALAERDAIVAQEAATQTPKPPEIGPVSPWWRDAQISGIPVQFDAFEITDHDRFVMAIDMSGHVRFGKGYSPDVATKQFMHEMSKYFHNQKPCQ